MTSQEQYKFFHLLTTKPEIWSKYTAYDLWADEYISQKMLAYHLDATSELASRPHDFINRSVQWITSRFKLPSGQKVIDFGCGPGMYTNGFHDAGAHVTGIDFSPRSIEYARRSAQQENRSIKYVQGNY
ncbi:MAG: class I SAM-dependent methyltransferase, partial [Ignavibacteriales bacterium]|nr:class I SAM-dependent methyltransferase [Ignavibacteriales bacterium]